MPAKHSPIVASMLLLAVVVGCDTGGAEVAPVSGRVTLDGRALASADVSFQPDGAQRASSGRTDADGRYQLMFKRGQPGALVGEHTVRISISRELVRNPPQIPARYDTQSELRREVKAGEDNVFDFELSTGAN
ncbi:MAG TPA: carboxypeptidase-like regulatory domain-containing protein [Lacipirellulaceae bacterium]|nr:carboxypeptidase-like regulatory domain-containing protein [Lacipirellulaceae bacterium]